MKTRSTLIAWMTTSFVILISSFVISTRAQSYSIDWFKIAGGGGTSAGGVYSVSGTIGQTDAGATMSGGNFTLQGGFWSVIAAVQTPGAPRLSVMCTESNTLVVFWPANAQGWQLYTTTNLMNGCIWTEIAAPYQTNGTNFQRIEPLPQGNRFYRLHKP